MGGTDINIIYTNVTLYKLPNIYSLYIDKKIPTYYSG